MTLLPPSVEALGALGTKELAAAWSSCTTGKSPPLGLFLCCAEGREGHGHTACLQGCRRGHVSASESWGAARPSGEPAASSSPLLWIFGDSASYRAHFLFRNHVFVREKERQSSRLLLHSSKGCSTWGWAGLKLGAGARVQPRLQPGHHHCLPGPASAGSGGQEPEAPI